MRQIPNLISALRILLVAPIVWALHAGQLALALELFIGFLNTLQWYPWPFPFKETHYALAWIIVGALLVHLAVMIYAVRGGLSIDQSKNGLITTDLGMWSAESSSLRLSGAPKS